MIPSIVAAVVIAAASQDVAPPASSIIDEFRAESRALMPLLSTQVARRFSSAATCLPPCDARPPIHRDSTSQSYYTEAEVAAMTSEAALESIPVTPFLYYKQFFGTPLLYTRAIDIASTHGISSMDEARVFDFGFGQIGHLRMLASLGAHVTGVEVNPVVRALYAEPGDVGPIARCETAGPGADGSLAIVMGRWPGDEGIAQQVGASYDLIISKNVLKRGYIHPERDADPRMLIDLGVDDERFCTALHDALAPGGLVVIYNFAPPPAAEDEPYIPWADGRCPFERSLLESIGFEVLAYDVNDDEAARAHFIAVGAMAEDDDPNALNGTYTVFRRPVHPASP